jgi:hypothetical protein
MSLSSKELEMLKANSLNLSDAKTLSDLISNDHSVGGIFPNGANGDFTNPDIEAFKAKYCSWWPIARILFVIGKIFTKEKGDKVIDALISLGDQVCGTGATTKPAKPAKAPKTPKAPRAKKTK